MVTLKSGPIPVEQTQYAYEARCSNGLWSVDIVNVTRITDKTVWVWEFGFERRRARETAGPNSTVYFRFDQGREFFEFMDQQVSHSIADLQADLEKQRKLKQVLRTFKKRGYAPQKIE